MSERPVVFSASSVNAYLDCHLRWYFTYVLNEQGEQSEAQNVGIYVHDIAAIELENMADGIVPTGPDYDIPHLKPLLEVFRRDILPTYRDPVLIEASFQIAVNGIPFSGIIDSVDRQDIGPNTYANILRDLKTTGKRPPVGRYRFNMIGYDMGAESLGCFIDIMQLDYIVRTQKPYYWPEVVAAPDEDDIEWFAATLQAVADGVGRADYKPTGVGTRVCSYCPHKAICGPYSRYKEVTQ